MVRHDCDETTCENWKHLVSGSQPENVRAYLARRGREHGPLAGHRGARGRAVAAISRAAFEACRPGALNAHRTS